MSPNTKAIIDHNTAIVWLRRDLRLHDNAALYYALKENKQVLPLFIFDTTILNELEDTADARVTFIHDALAMLKAQLEELGSSLLVLHGDPVKIYKELTPKAVYANGDYEPAAIKRDITIERMLQNREIPYRSFKDQVIFEKNEVLKGDGTPYTVFTPYSRKWKAALTDFFIKEYPVEKYFHNLKKTGQLQLPTLKKIGFTRTELTFPERVIRLSVIEKYDKTRDYPAIDGTSRLSVHLRFGTVSIRKLVKTSLKKNETWLNELIWREFYMMILWHYPHVTTSAFKPVYDHVSWRNNEKEFKAWCNGMTGYPIVDAGMRELNATGYMHNRVRMITASFLIKHLLIDWRWGEAYFAGKLLDYDLAANNGGWQWAASSGCDAAPYFRVFNPTLQAEKFDPENKYIERWVPEYGTNAYPRPIVDHVLARERVLAAYKEALDHSAVH